MTKITFSSADYDEATLKGMEDVDLLSLRNLVATNMGVSTIKSFRDHDQAVEATWKALNKWNEKATAEENQAAGEAIGTVAVKTPKPPKPVAVPKEPVEVKGAKPKTVKRPTRNMFRRLQKLVEKPDRGGKRWDNYKDGMTILDTIEGDDMTQLDVSFYVNNGYVKLIEPTTEEFETGLSAWFARNGIDDPTAEKKRKDAERASTKATKDAERESAKKKRDDDKAAKDAEREAAKKKRDDDKAAKDAGASSAGAAIAGATAAGTATS